MTPFRSRLDLETLDRRDVPASLADPNAPLATVFRYEPPGCWPGPPPYRVALTAPVMDGVFVPPSTTTIPPILVVGR